MSVFGAADDETYTEYDGDEQVNDEVVEVSDVLREEAVSAQRLMVSRNYREHVHGRAHVAVVDPKRKLTGEKLFNIDNLIDWDEGEPDVVIKALAEGRVRARLSARMGLGKSTRLAPLIARNLNKRVLLVSLDAACLGQIGDYVAAIGLGKFRKNWPTKKGEAICYMTYADFCGFMVGGDRSRLFASFDVIIFDEAFVGTADVFVAKRAFSAYAHPETSLLLCSATIRKDGGGEDGGAKSLGSFKRLDTTWTVESAIASGKLVADFLVDRTVVFVPTDEQAEMLREHYEENGVESQVLDSASGLDDVRSVCSWLDGDSSTQRVLVAHVSFGIGFNFPASYGIIWPQREVIRVDQFRVYREIVPLCEEMITQMKSRTGRGIVSGSGGLIMATERSKAEELYEDQRNLAFVKMSACGLIPLKNGTWASSYAVYPSGLTPSQAVKILKISIPVEVASRFFAKDGMAAGKYANALNFFSQPDHFLLGSAHKDPVGLEQWPLQGFGMTGTDVVQHVPVEAEGELQVVLHAIVAMAEGKFTATRWRPSIRRSLGGYESDGESSSVASVTRRLRRVTTTEPVDVLVRQPSVPSWSYQPTAVEHGEDRRGGRYIDSARFKEAVSSLNSLLGSYAVPEVACDTPVSPVDGEKVELEVPSLTSVVESPGGTPVCTLPREPCTKMHKGVVLEPDEFLDVFWSAKPVGPAFAGSRLFDNFAGPWESLLRTVAQPEVVERVVSAGEASAVYKLVDMLRGRFNIELLAVLRTSNLIRTRYRKLFSRPPSPEYVMKKILHGDFSNIAQTSGFFDRVVLLKNLIDRALLAAESQNVYLANPITAAQRMQYVGNAGNYVGAVGHGLHPSYGYPGYVNQSDRLRIRQGVAPPSYSSSDGSGINFGALRNRQMPRGANWNVM